MNFKSEKGSITIFVVVTLLFMTTFLIIMYANNVNKSKIVKEQAEIINSIYQMKIETTNEVYDRLTATPIIDIKLSEITNGVIDIVVEANSSKEEVIIEYIIDNQKFDSKEELYQYIEENELHDIEKELTIIATKDAKNTTQITQKVKFVKPSIETITTPFITNITSVESAYATYDELGKKEEIYTIEGVNKEFRTMAEIVRYIDDWLFENQKYDIDINIIITAKGNNNLTSKSMQQIKFIRGTKVTNETELNTALASTSPSYIQIVNNISCNSAIDIDGVTHSLDLNNYEVSRTLQSGSYTFITLGSNTKLTILDSSAEKQGTILVSLENAVASDGNNRETNITCIQNSGTLTLESGIISSSNTEKMLSAKNGTNLDNNSVTIWNIGTTNLNGGTLKSNVVTQACTYMAVKTSQSYGYGIFNKGTVNLNSGTIITNAEAYMIRASGATVWGKTYAYAYGIESTGTINRNGNIAFTTTADAYEEGTYQTGKNSVDIKED